MTDINTMTKIDFSLYPEIVNFDSDHQNLTYAARNAVHRPTNWPASSKDSLWLEMGTATGRTAKIIQKSLPPNKMLYTFDCFSGLPEPWSSHKKGSFAQEPPDLDPSCIEIVEGLFEATLPLFLEKHKGPISFLHIDCDLYSSTKTIFKYLKNRILPGTIIVFDEIHGTIVNQDPEFNDEARAFGEFVKENNVRYKFFSKSRGNQASCMILALDHEVEHSGPTNTINKGDTNV